MTITTDPSILAALARQANERADAACFRIPKSAANNAGSSVTFGEIHRRAQQLVALLGDSAYEPGARVVFLHHNSWHWLPLLAACAARGLTLVPLNPDLHRDELISTIRHADPRLIVGDMSEDKLPSYARAARTLTLESLIAELPTSVDVTAQADPEVPALIIYTSGTTGGSKAVMLPERSLLFAATSISRFYKFRPTDSLYSILPYHHMNAVMASGLIPFVAGAQVLIGDTFGFTNAKTYWQSVADEGATIISLIPSIMATLLRLDPGGTKANTERIRFSLCGAAPLPASLWREFEDVFRIPVYQGYGLTETSFWVTCIPPDVPRRYETVGVPVDCEISIDPEGATTAIEADGRRRRSTWAPESDETTGGSDGPVLGEVLIKTDGATTGYYRNKKLSDTVMTPEGYFRTGDVGYLDDEGYLRIVGRKKEIIIRNGVNVLPDEVDAVVSQHELVKESKTIGVADDLVGERILTVCVLKTEPTEQRLREIRTWAREQLSPHKRPDEVRALPYLPRGVTGKISSATLRRVVSGELADDIMKVLLKRKYKRAEPSDLTAIRTIVHRATTTGEPIHFVQYWGIGDRDTMNEFDRDGLELLAELVAATSIIPEVRAKLTIIIPDMHARLNGRVPDRAARYMGEIAKSSREHGFEVIFDSEIWLKGGLHVEDVVREALDPDFDERWDSLPVRDRLILQASKHSREREAEEGARVYIVACIRANPLIERFYPNAIFLTYNPPEFDITIPNLPRLYIFPSKRGSSDKPWFT